MKTKLENYKRKEIFEYYDGNTKPFASVTTKIDVTNIYKLSRKYGHFYALMGYYLTKAMNTIEEFRITYENGEFYLNDTIVPSYVDVLNNGVIGFFDVSLTDDFEEYLKNFDNTKKRLLEKEELPLSDGTVVWLSCEPWFKSTSIDPPYDKNERVTQLIWDKYEFEGDKCFVNLTIFFHHGLMDGLHIGKLLENIEKTFQNIA